MDLHDPAPPRTLATSAALIALSALAACGGGGDANGAASSVQPVAITEFTAQAQAALSGDWPLQVTTTAFLVRSDAEWQQAWQTRLQAIAPRCARPYNAAACAAQQPPAVDFARYTVVGLLLDPLHYYSPPTPRRLDLDTAADTLLLQYGYGALLTTPFQLITGTRFFLVPRTTATLVVQASAE